MWMNDSVGKSDVTELATLVAQRTFQFLDTLAGFNGGRARHGTAYGLLAGCVLAGFGIHRDSRQVVWATGSVTVPTRRGSFIRRPCGQLWNQWLAA